MALPPPNYPPAGFPPIGGAAADAAAADLAARLESLAEDDEDAIVTLDGEAGGESKSDKKDKKKKKKKKKRSPALPGGSDASARRASWKKNKKKRAEDEEREPPASLSREEDLALDYAAAGLKKPAEERKPPGYGGGGEDEVSDAPGRSVVVSSSASTSAAASTSRSAEAPAYAGASFAAMRSPTVNEERRVFGRDPVAALLFGLAAGLGVAMLLGLAITRGSGADEIKALEAELEEAYRAPSAVEAGEVRAAAMIRKDLDELYRSMKNRFLLVFVLVGGPLGYAAGRIRIDKNP
jgi:hypothetical protein